MNNKSKSWTEISKNWLDICFYLIEKLPLVHRELPWGLSFRPILGHNPAARLTDTRTIRPRKRNTFAQGGILKHPLLLLQEHFIPGSVLTHKQRQMKERHKNCSWKFHQKEMKGMWISSYAAAVYSRAQRDPGSMALPKTHCTEGSGGLGADSWAFLSPLLQGQCPPVTPAPGTMSSCHPCLRDMPPWRKTGQAAMEIKLTMLPWCVNTSESARKLHLPSPNTPAPASWLCTFARDRAFSTLQESPSHSAGGISWETHTKPWWEGWRGQNGTGFDQQAEVGHSEPWWKAAWTLAWWEKILQFYNCAQHVRDGMQDEYPYSRLHFLLNKQYLPVLGHCCRAYSCQIPGQWYAMSGKTQYSTQF